MTKVALWLEANLPIVAFMASVSARALAALLSDWRGASAAPAYGALADRIRLLILDGRVSYGTRLPAERELAAQLGVSRTTITATYTQLRDGGFLESLRGSGSTARIPISGTIPAGGVCDLSFHGEIEGGGAPPRA